MSNNYQTIDRVYLSVVNKAGIFGFLILRQQPDFPINLFSLKIKERF